MCKIGRVFRQTFSNCQDKIDDFSLAFLHLKESLTTGVLVSNALVSLRTDEKIDSISEPSFLARNNITSNTTNRPYSDL